MNEYNRTGQLRERVADQVILAILSNHFDCQMSAPSSPRQLESYTAPQEVLDEFNQRMYS